MNASTQAVLARARRLLHDHRQRARMNGVTLDYGLLDIRRLIESSPCCRWCRLPVAFDFQVDHIHPIARGGLYALRNLCVACGRCNRLRGMLTEAETLQLIEFLKELHPVARQDLERRLISGGRRYRSQRET